MKLAVSEILRRGFESMLANWPLLLIRVGEAVVMVLVFILAVTAVIVPVAVSFGAGAADSLGDPSDVPSIVLGIIAEHAMVIIYLLLLVLAISFVVVAVHSFVVGGSARIYIDSLQSVSTEPVPARGQLEAFSMDRWASGGKASWWPIFWIYNIAWSIAFLVILVPLVIIGLVALLARDVPAAAIGIGCVGILFGVLLILPVAVITAITTQRAIVDCVARSIGAAESLRAGWREFRSDMGRHLAIALIMFVISIALGSVFGSMSSFMTFGRTPAEWNMAMLPLQFGTSLLESLFSTVVGAWFLACFAALPVESRA